MDIYKDSTPRPWKVVQAGDNYWIQDQAGRIVAFIGGRNSIFTKDKDTPHAVNAALIVHAVNSHEPPPAACKEAGA